MASSDSPLFDLAITAIDAANAQDPNLIVVDGHEIPKEVAHGAMVTAWVLKLSPDASVSLLFAARAHHIRRWLVPRSDYPQGRAGYLKWRIGLHDIHAREVGVVLAEVGIDEAIICRTQDLVRKKNLGKDPEVQVLEDALCLVFLETQLHGLAARLDAETVIRALVRSLAKMSDAGKAAAAGIALADSDRLLLSEAIERHRS